MCRDNDTLNENFLTMKVKEHIDQNVVLKKGKRTLWPKFHYKKITQSKIN